MHAFAVVVVVASSLTLAAFAAQPALFAPGELARHLDVTAFRHGEHARARTIQLDSLGRLHYVDVRGKHADHLYVLDHFWHELRGVSCGRTSLLPSASRTMTVVYTPDARDEAALALAGLRSLQRLRKNDLVFASRRQPCALGKDANATSAFAALFKVVKVSRSKATTKKKSRRTVTMHLTVEPASPLEALESLRARVYTESMVGHNLTLEDYGAPDSHDILRQRERHLPRHVHQRVKAVHEHRRRSELMRQIYGHVRNIMHAVRDHAERQRRARGAAATPPEGRWVLEPGVFETQHNNGFEFVQFKTPSKASKQRTTSQSTVAVDKEMRALNGQLSLLRAAHASSKKQRRASGAVAAMAMSTSAAPSPMPIVGRASVQGMAAFSSVHEMNWIDRVGMWYDHLKTDLGHDMKHDWEAIERHCREEWKNIHDIYNQLSPSLKSLLDVLALSIKLDKKADLASVKEGYTTPASLHDYVNLDKTGFEFHMPVHLDVELHSSQLTKFEAGIGGRLEVDAVAQLQTFKHSMKPLKKTLWDKGWPGLTFPVMGVVSFTFDPHTSMDIELQADSVFATEPIGVKVSGAAELLFGKTAADGDWGFGFQSSLKHTLLKGGINDAHARATFAIQPELSANIDMGVLLGPQDTANLARLGMQVPGMVELSADATNKDVTKEGKICLNGQYAIAVKSHMHVGLNMFNKQIIPGVDKKKTLWTSKRHKALWCASTRQIPKFKTLTEVHRYINRMGDYIERLEKAANIKGGYKLTKILPPV